MRPTLRIVALIASSALPWVAGGGALDDLGPLPRGNVRLVLIRHGQAYSNLEPPPPLPPDQLDRLTDLGRAQARQAAQALRRSNVTLVFSSPAGRARQTAEEIGSLLSAPVRVEPQLRPLELGRSPSGELLDWDQRIAEWTAGHDPVPAGGESLEQLGQRMAGLVTIIRREHAGKTIVLVAHSEVIGAYLGLLGGRPGASSYPPRIANGSLSVLDAPIAGKPGIRLSNHLPPSSPAP